MTFPLAGLTFRVADLEGQASFYERVLGLERRRSWADGCRLAGPDGAFVVGLAEDPDAQPRPRPTVGLFHAAFLLPDRSSLASALVHLQQAGAKLEGAADHGVSEALYLSDHEGNGIELYHDRPREEWPTRGEHVAMTTDPLDVPGLRAEADGARPPGVGTVLGHVHLCVPELAPAERFFREGLGLRVRQRDYPGALFLAVDDYHHHVAVNTWARGRRAPGDAVGLSSYTWTGDPDRARERFEALDCPVRSIDEGVEVEDPAGLTLRVVPG